MNTEFSAAELASHAMEIASALWQTHGPEVSLGVGVFLALVTLLTALILIAQAWLMPAGKVRIVVNDETVVDAGAGLKLIRALADGGIELPSACGGKGTCGECKTVVRRGAGIALPTEQSRLGRALIRQGYRLSCQLTVKQDLQVVVPPDLLESRNWLGVVRSNRCLTPLIKELVLELPDPPMPFRAGQYVLLKAPSHRLQFVDIVIDEAFRRDWDRFDWWRYASGCDEPITRSYSMANAPAEGNRVVLNVRLALPPPNRPEIPPGRMSAYLFSLQAGQQVELTGAYGDFRIDEGPREMVFVGGGAGMAPLRSMIVDQLERLGTPRTMSYWYGARSVRELFYADTFERLARQYPNFSWQVALSEPRPEDAWEGPTGFIHQVLFERYLEHHAAPEDCDYYLCGPPPMLKAVLALLDNLGVDPDQIHFDDFGG